MSDLIIAPAVQEGISLTAGAMAQVKKLTGFCALVVAVKNPQMRLRAVDAATNARRFIKQVEEARTTLNAPYLKAQRTINELAAQLKDPLQQHVARIDKLLTGFEIAERQRIAEEQRKAEAEAKRLQEAADLEARRIADAAAAAATAAATPVAAQQALDLGAAQAKQVLAAAAAPVVVMSPPRPMGMSVKPDRWNYEVIDKLALANHDINLVRIEPAALAIRERIDAGARDIPGLRIFQETKVNTTAR